jgi:hypothetical protein
MVLIRYGLAPAHRAVPAGDRPAKVPMIGRSARARQHALVASATPWGAGAAEHLAGLRRQYPAARVICAIAVPTTWLAGTQRFRPASPDNAS